MRVEGLGGTPKVLKFSDPQHTNATIGVPHSHSRFISRKICSNEIGL